MKLLVNEIKALKELIWINDNYSSFEDVVEDLPLSYEDILEAEKRLNRFAPFIEKVFPETKDGIIESPISEIHHMKMRMEKDYGQNIYGNLILKRDDLLPIAGSIDRKSVV